MANIVNDFFLHASGCVKFAFQPYTMKLVTHLKDGHEQLAMLIDGILYDKLSLPHNVHDSLTSRIKILSELKIDEHRIPQDGRFAFKIDNQEVDIRVSIP